MRNIYQTKLESFYESNKRMPTYSEMLKLFGFKSKNAVYKLVNKLVEEGVVRKDSSGRLVPNNIFGEVPVLGLVEAGLRLRDWTPRWSPLLEAFTESHLFVPAVDPNGPDGADAEPEREPGQEG